MPFDISALLRSPDIRDIDPARARLVGALRYCHVARCAETYCPNRLGQHLGCRAAVASFHVLLDEMGRAWPEPIALNRPCNPRLSYDETLITDLCMAAMRGDRGGFDLADRAGDRAQ